MRFCKCEKKKSRGAVRKVLEGAHGISHYTLNQNYKRLYTSLFHDHSTRGKRIFISVMDFSWRYKYGLKYISYRETIEAGVNFGSPENTKFET